MAKYEYQILHQAVRAIVHLNKQLNAEVEEGWEPVSFTGDQNISILMRRPKAQEQSPPQQA